MKKKVAKRRRMRLHIVPCEVSRKESTFVLRAKDPFVSLSQVPADVAA